MKLSFYTVTLDGQKYSAISYPDPEIAARHIGVEVDQLQPGIEAGLQYWTARIPVRKDNEMERDEASIAIDRLYKELAEAVAKMPVLPSADFVYAVCPGCGESVYYEPILYYAHQERTDHASGEHLCDWKELWHCPTCSTYFYKNNANY